MNNNTFYLVFREPDHRNVKKNPNQDPWGWEFVDGIEIFSYKEVKVLLEEYSLAFPKFVVRIRAVPTKPGLYTEEDIKKMKPQ